MIDCGGERGFTKDYLVLLQTEIDNMRRKDPRGRRVSNQYTGWQSNDGCESSPIFQKLMNEIVIYSQIYNYKRWMQRNKLY